MSSVSRGTKRRNFIRFFAAKAYDPNEARNPLFPRPKSTKKLWLLICVFMTLAIVVAGVVVMLYGPYLKIRHVEVMGTVTLSKADMESLVQAQLLDKIWLVVPGDHQWFFQQDKVITKLSSAFPLKSAVIARQGDTLRVTIVEDVFMVAFRSGEEVYFLDPTGVIIRLATPEEKAAVLVKIGAVPAPVAGEGTEAGVLAVLQPDMPVLREKVSTPRSIGDQIFDAEKIENILTFAAGLSDIQILPKEFVSDDIVLPWFAVTSDQDFLVLFDASADKDPKQQLILLKTVIDEHFATQESPDYIDVRFGTRVYVR